MYVIPIRLISLFYSSSSHIATLDHFVAHFGHHIGIDMSSPPHDLHGVARMVRKTHDPLFKLLFGPPEHAAALIRHILPTRILDQLPLSAMQPVAKSFVNEQLSERLVDLLFSVPTPDGEVLVYVLVEHQSLDDVDMPLRILEYMVRIWADHRRRKPREPLPPIIPILVCHPPGGWTAPRRFDEMFAGHADLFEFVPAFELALLDLSELASDELKTWSLHVVRKLALWLLRDARDIQRLFDELPSWAPQFEEALASESGLQLVAVMFRYIMLVHADIRFDDLLARVSTMSPAIQRSIMTTGEMLMAEGREAGHEAGRAAGRREALITLLTHRFGELGQTERERVEQAGLALLDTWMVRVLDASTLDDVFAKA
jgi:predicted transposase/invertase (TIGR01784 family)